MNKSYMRQVRADGTLHIPADIVREMDIQPGDTITIEPDPRGGILVLIHNKPIRRNQHESNKQHR